MSVLQGHIEGGLLTPGVVQASVFTSALADFDALLQLSRDALALAPCAVLSHKAQRAAVEQQGFSSAASILPLEALQEGSKRCRAMLKALPQGKPACCPYFDVYGPYTEQAAHACLLH